MTGSVRGEPRRYLSRGMIRGAFLLEAEGTEDLAKASREDQIDPQIHRCDCLETIH